MTVVGMTALFTSDNLSSGPKKGGWRQLRESGISTKVMLKVFLEEEGFSGIDRTLPGVQGDDAGVPCPAVAGAGTAQIRLSCGTSRRASGNAVGVGTRDISGSFIPQLGRPDLFDLVNVWFREIKELFTNIITCESAKFELISVKSTVRK